MNATILSLKAVILGDLPNEKDLPNEECWRVWAKKINSNSEWSPEQSVAFVTPFTPQDPWFRPVGECWDINRLKDRYLKKAQNIEQFFINFVDGLNAAEFVGDKSFETMRNLFRERYK